MEMSSSSSSSSSRPTTSSVQVVVRLRPLNSQETKHGTLPVVKASTNDRTVTVLKGTGHKQQKTTYKYDNVFSSFSTQQDVFEATLQPVIKDVLMGYESTVFAYGQTGTGKTHTMEGDIKDETKQAYGVIPRSAEKIFHELASNPEYASSSVHCSMLEIYNEELCDLLASSSTSPTSASGGSATSSRSSKAGTSAGTTTKLAIMEGKNGPFCRGLSEQKVESFEQITTILSQAQQQRQVGETNMNKQSSRSHCIFTLRINAQRKLADGSVLDIVGKLHCVDLAGSECAKSANLDGSGGAEQAARERERMNINRSLLTLGRVVSTLKELSQNGGKSSSKKSVRIPYRDSKLTRILQESLGGRCKCVVIATVSPSVTAVEETISTLNYAQAANGIKNKPVTTSSMTVGSSASATVSSSMPGDRGATSVEHWHEMEARLTYFQQQVDEAQQALARKHIQHQELVDRAETAEASLEVVKREQEQSLRVIDDLEGKLRDMTNRAELSEKELRDTRVVLEATRQTEVALSSEAKNLIDHLKTTIECGNALHSQLTEQSQIDIRRRVETKLATEKQVAVIEGIIRDLCTMSEMHTNHKVEMLDQDSNYVSNNLKTLHGIQSIIDEMKEECEKRIVTLRQSILSGYQNSFQPFAESLHHSLQEIISVSGSSKDQLMGHCQELQSKLEHGIAVVSSFEEKFRADSENLNGAIEGHFNNMASTTKEHTSYLIKSRELESSERNKSSSNLLRSLDEWKQSCSASLDTVNSLVVCNTDNISSMLDSFSNEFEQSQSCIQSKVDRSAIDRKNMKDEYMKQLENQNRLLKSQCDSIAASQAKQESLNDLMVSNVMEKIQATLRKEMDAIKSFQTQSYQSLLDSSAAACSGNDAVLTTTTSTFDQLEKSSEELVEQIDASYACQRRLVTNVTDTVKQFGTEFTSSYRQEDSKLNTCALASCDILESHKSQDEKSTRSFVEQLNTNLDQHSQTISMGVENVRNAVSVLSENVNASLKSMKDDIIQPANTTVSDKLCQSIVHTQDDIGSKALDCEHFLGFGEAIVESEALSNAESTVAMKTALGSFVNDKLSTSLYEHRDSIEARQWLKESVNSCDQKVQENISNAKLQLSSTKAEADNIANRIIKVNEEVPAAQEFTVPGYSETLSSTPSDEIVLQRHSKSDQQVDETKENESGKSPILARSRSSSIPVLQVHREQDAYDKCNDGNVDSKHSISPSSKRTVPCEKSMDTSETRSKRARVQSKSK